MKSRSLSWGIIGAGNIAQTFAAAIAKSRTGKLVAVGSRDGNSAAQFVESHPGVRSVSGYAGLIEDSEVEAIYIATPHPMHARWTIHAARSGKHILCEKPLAVNAPQAMAVANEAKKAGVFLMEAFMYRCHPQTQKAVDLIAEGAIGEVRSIEAEFGFSAPFSKTSRLFSNELAGGGILDVGCYPVSMSRLLAGAAAGLPFLDPLKVTGVGCLHEETGVDEYAAATLLFPGGILARIACATSVRLSNRVKVRGTKGWFEISDPWIPAREGGTTEIVLQRGSADPETLAISTDQYLYALEIDAVGDAVFEGRVESEFMSTADTLGNMHTLDAWRDAIGLVYESEQLDAEIPPVDGRDLAVSPTAEMPCAHIPGIEKPVSRLIFGCDNQRSISHGSVVWDEFFSAGGNAFDTAAIYCGGLQERLLGRWIEMRGIREQVVVIAKGAHTPNCNPHSLVAQFEESLDHLRTDYADLYLMHRDNPAVPVDEFLDTLEGLRKAGKLKAYGGSNWTLERLREINACAAARGLPPFAAVSNNFSLARMVDPVWAGCISAADDDFRSWFLETRTPLLAWSSQARGFFVDRPADSEQIRCWHREDNFERRRRAFHLASEIGRLPVEVAAAYVLSQEFPTFALIGPRTLEETVSSLSAANLRLSPAQCRWLDLQTDELPHIDKV